MVVGDIVKRKNEDVYGVVVESMFGLTVAFWENDNEDETLGAAISALEKYWEVVDLPDNYEIDEHGLPVKMRNL